MGPEDSIKAYLEKTRPMIDREIEKLIPRRMDSSSLAAMFGKPRYVYDEESLTKSLSEPVWDLLDRGGKRWRPALFLLIVEALGKNPDDWKDIAAITEVVHEGSLIIDDIEDRGELRRGKPCTHKLFGEDIAINAGNFMYYAPVKALMKRELDKETLKRAYDAYIQEMINISLGQGMDIWWHKGKNPYVKEEQYLQMVAYKTGTLVRMAARLAVIVSGGTDEQEEKIGALAEALGVGFQIQDDILDIISSGEDRKCFGKPTGNDITEGKRTLMVIRTLQTSDPATRKRLLEILDSHTRDPKLIKDAIDIIRKSGSVEYARKKGNEIVENAWKEAEPHIPESGAKNILKALIEFSLSRKH
jgi:geranylgeranyl diphosphate synthase type I